MRHRGRRDAQARRQSPFGPIGRSPRYSRRTFVVDSM
jgi:hypothetical protein